MRHIEEEEIAQHLRLGEDGYCEFKQIEFKGDAPKSPRRDGLADELAAFANARGGVMLCGVTDAGTVQGMSRKQMDAMERRLHQACASSIKPPIYPEIARMELDGKALLLVRVPEGEAQHDSPGGSYLRCGSSKEKLDSEGRLRLAQRRGQARVRSPDATIVRETGFGTLDESLWKPLLGAEGATEPEAALGKLTLLAPDEAGTPRATVAGVLLCTQNPEGWIQNACIAATRYRGQDRASGQLDAQEITGPLNRQIADAAAFAKRNMHVAARKEPGRVELPQYSDKALFEALVNAVAHRDYSMRESKVRLSMFADRLEIQSPGDLPGNLTVDSMAMRQASRNEALTSVLARMPVGETHGAQERQYFMERRGDGVLIIRRETQALCGKLPEYRLVDNAEVLVSIPAATLEPSPAQVTVAAHGVSGPVPDVDVLALFPNKTWKRASTGEHGEACLDLHSTHLPMTVFAAANGFAALLERAWTPASHAFSLQLEALPGGGGAIFPEATGCLPGLRGRLNPILDTMGRAYLYASNIAINQGAAQPVPFAFGERLRLTDADGHELEARIVHIEGRSALVEYRPWGP